MDILYLLIDTLGTINTALFICFIGFLLYFFFDIYTNKTHH